MIIENRLKQHFNGFLFFMRITFFAIGIMFIINHRWWSSVVFLFFALLTFYTVSGTAIDLNLRRVKSYYLIFGIIKTGNWQPIEDYEKLKVVPVSHGNPVMNILDKKGLKEVDEYRVILKSKTKKEPLPLKSCKTLEEAQVSATELSGLLKLPFSIIKIPS
jgi:hypothetical protein